MIYDDQSSVTTSHDLYSSAGLAKAEKKRGFHWPPQLCLLPLVTLGEANHIYITPRSLDLFHRQIKEKFSLLSWRNKMWMEPPTKIGKTLSKTSKQFPETWKTSFHIVPVQSQTLLVPTLNAALPTKISLVTEYGPLPTQINSETSGISNRKTQLPWAQNKPNPFRIHSEIPTSQMTKHPKLCGFQPFASRQRKLGLAASQSGLSRPCGRPIPLWPPIPGSMVFLMFFLMFCSSKHLC